MAGVTRRYSMAEGLMKKILLQTWLCSAFDKKISSSKNIIFQRTAFHSEALPALWRNDKHNRRFNPLHFCSHPESSAFDMARPASPHLCFFKECKCIFFIEYKCNLQMKRVSLCKDTAIRFSPHEFYELHGELYLRGANAPFFKQHIPWNSSTQLTGLHNVRSVHIHDMKRSRVR